MFIWEKEEDTRHRWNVSGTGLTLHSRMLWTEKLKKLKRCKAICSYLQMVFKIGPQACNFIKKRLRHRCFPVKFAKFLRAPFFTEHFQSYFCSRSKPIHTLLRALYFMNDKNNSVLFLFVWLVSCWIGFFDQMMKNKMLSYFCIYKKSRIN